jgi:HPt (histidine-containing phosphotransfer) domain-containing protein
MLLKSVSEMTLNTYARNPVPSLHRSFPSGDQQEWIDLQQLVDRCLGNLELADRLIARFRERVAETRESLQQALNREETGTIGQLAHRLKGESANLGSGTLARLASELECAAAENRTQDVRVITEQLLRACQQFSENVFTFRELSNDVPEAGSRTGPPYDSGRPE